MCFGCYQEIGKPHIINDLTIAASKAIALVYEHDAVGGDAHIVVDDWNLEDSNIKWCIEHAHDERENAREAALSCLNLLLTMSIEERASALAIYSGYLETTVQTCKP